MAYGWLPARLLPPDQEEARAIGELLRSVCPFSVTLGRYFTPCPSYRVDTTYESTAWPNGDKFPFGPAVCLSGQLAVRQVATHDAYVPSSKILSIATCSGHRRFRLAAYPPRFGRTNRRAWLPGSRTALPAPRTDPGSRLVKRRVCTATPVSFTSVF